MPRGKQEEDRLAVWRPHFSVEMQRRGEELSLAGRVLSIEREDKRVAASVRDESQTFQPSVDIGSRNIHTATCSCGVFRQLEACRHLWALLCALSGAAMTTGEDAPSAGPRSALRMWLEGLDKLERESREAERGPEGESRDCRVDYVLLLDDEAAVVSAVLETRRAKRLLRGGYGKSVPFPLALGSSEVVLAPADRRIAAMLRGAGTALAAGMYRPSHDARYLLDSAQVEALLPEMAATGRLFWQRRSVTSEEALALDTHGPWDLCMDIATEGSDIKLGAHLVRGGERVEFAQLRGVLPGDCIVLDTRIVRTRLGRGRAWLANLLSTPLPPIAKQESTELLRELARRDLDVEPGSGMEDLVVARPPIPRLTLTPPPRDEGSGWGPPAGEIEFDYKSERVHASDPRPLLIAGRGVLRRYRAVEDAFVARVLELGAEPLGDKHGRVRVPLSKVPELVAQLEREGWKVQGEGARWRKLHTPSMRISAGADWLELDGRVEGMSAATFPKLLAALRRGESTVALEDGSTGVLPEAWVKRWKRALLLADTKGGKLRFGRNQAWFVDFLLDEHVEAESRRRWEEQRSRLDEFKTIHSVHESEDFCGELRPYQREGLGWLEFLERHRFGGCLADDMGLGKTVQVLAWLVARKRREPDAGPTLVVAPKSLTHNWIEEARRFAPALATLEYAGTDRTGRRAKFERVDVIVTTFGTVRSDIEWMSKLKFGVVVIDEAQAVKNDASRIARAVRLLVADHRVALSGTPIENHLGELWSLFEFLNPGMLGRSSAFQSLVAGTGDIEGDKDVRVLVAAAVRPFLLRRRKEEVLSDLPARAEQTVTCDMDPAQRREYEELRVHFRRELLERRTYKELERDKLHVLEMLLRLRQAACHPGLLDPARIDESCAKFDTFLPMLDEVLESGHKALVFSQFTSFLAILRRRLDAAGRNFGYLDGQTSAADRAIEVRRFQEEPERNVFLLSLKAGGVGLNLTAADYVFLLDPWWNPAVEAQAIGRSHRIGQTRKVFAYRMICGGTIEQRVIELQESKRELASAILDADSSLLRDLTRDDLERLLS